MKNALLTIALFSAFSAHAAYECQGPKGTAIESFKLIQITRTVFDAELDGRLDGEASEKNGILEYVYNNGCDNDITIRVNKMVLEGEPEPST